MLPKPKPIKRSETPIPVEDLTFAEAQILYALWQERLRRLRKNKRKYRADNSLVRQLVTDLDNLKKHQQVKLEQMTK